MLYHVHHYVCTDGRGFNCHNSVGSFKNYLELILSSRLTHDVSSLLAGSCKADSGIGASIKEG